jgi:hypothetical protein
MLVSNGMDPSAVSMPNRLIFYRMLLPVSTYINIKKKNICDIATTPPIKKPTAMELWNFLMIMVPPILRASNINADHIDVNASLNPRVDMTAHDMSARIPVKLRMEYLKKWCGTARQLAQQCLRFLATNQKMKFRFVSRSEFNSKSC